MRCNVHRGALPLATACGRLTDSPLNCVPRVARRGEHKRASTQQLQHDAVPCTRTHAHARTQYQGGGAPTVPYCARSAGRCRMAKSQRRTTHMTDAHAAGTNQRNLKQHLADRPRTLNLKYPYINRLWLTRALEYPSTGDSRPPAQADLCGFCRPSRSRPSHPSWQTVCAWRS